MVWDIDEEVWGVLKWCNFWAFRGVSSMWFVFCFIGVVWGDL